MESSMEVPQKVTNIAAKWFSSFPLVYFQRSWNQDLKDRSALPFLCSIHSSQDTETI